MCSHYMSSHKEQIALNSKLYLMILETYNDNMLKSTHNYQ